jgi:hypothetical protein
MKNAENYIKYQIKRINRYFQITTFLIQLVYDRIRKLDSKKCLNNS